MPSIRLPDGARKVFAAPVTVADVAASIGPGLARVALAGKVDGRLVDTSYRIDRDADVAIVTDKDPEGLDLIRHSTAHLLAYAVKELFPDAQVTIGMASITTSATSGRSRPRTSSASRRSCARSRGRTCRSPAG